jgi:protein involved in polysaccharide export with SLBB domain
MYRRLFISVGALVALATAAPAQVVDTAAIIREIQQQVASGQMSVEEVLARLQAAGVTVEQVRERLRQAGYPEDLLDRYLVSGGPATAPTLSPAQVEAMLQRLSIPPVETGAEAAAAVADSVARDTLAVPTLLELPVFGRDLFERASTEFAPLTMGPVPPNYQLGPGDELVLILTGDVQDIYTLPVTREGFVVIPNVGRVSVNGLTLDQLRNALYTYLGRVYSGIRVGPEATAFFEVSIGALRRNQVFVIGEVERPGQYEVTSVSTVLDAMYQAGGPARNGSFRSVQVRRGDRVVSTLDIYEYLTRGSAGGDIALNQGDVVHVPIRGRRVQVEGNVMRPGIYELKGDEGLRALIELAGGVEPEADLRRVQIDRVLPPEQRQPGVGRSLIDVNVAALLDTEGELVPLEPGDEVHVFAVSGERRNTITLRGSVWSPGMYAYASGLTLADVIDRAGGLRDDAYLSRAQIIRMSPLDLSRRMIPVSLLDDLGIELREYDEIVVYSVSEFQARRLVTIHGAVRNPGTYELRDDMTVRDLVLEAGGLTEEAYLLEAEVARIEEQPERPGDLTRIIRVPIDSSYVVSGAAAQGGDGSSNGGTSAAEFTLDRYDNVFIRSRPGFEPQRTVTITGEVRFPGEYSLQRKDEDLLSLIERAGGLTVDAYAGGIRYFRVERPVGQPESHLARINVDLVEMLEDPSGTDRLVLVEGDSIDIPEYITTVQVEGAVLYPTSVIFESGKGLDYYVGRAGGYTRDADSGRTRVEYANGTVQTVSGWFIFSSKPEPEPGARVFVPAKPPTSESEFQFRNMLALLTAITTMVIVIARN